MNHRLSVLRHQLRSVFPVDGLWPEAITQWSVEVYVEMREFITVQEAVREGRVFGLRLHLHPRGERATYFCEGELEYMCLMLSYYSILARLSEWGPLFN
jgi:hypothetical protein